MALTLRCGLAALSTRLKASGALLSLGLGLGLAATPAARASSPEAWNAYGQKVLQACSAASTLHHIRPAGERLDLPAGSDHLTSVLLLQGSYPQPHMAGRRGLELCLYDASTGQVRLGEADRLYSGSPQP